MPKDVYYIKHDCNAHDDPKIKALRKKYGWEGFGWYWLIIEYMRSSESGKLEYNDILFDSLAEDFKCESSKAKQFIDDGVIFKLFSKNGTYFTSDRLLRDLKSYEEFVKQRIIAGKISGVKRNTRSTPVQHPLPPTDDEHQLNTRSTTDELLLDNTSDNEQSLNTRSTEAELLNKVNILNKEKYNVFKIYESNIGVLTPFLAEELKDIEKTYPIEWFVKAVKIACENNARSLKYIQAILQRWQTQGFKTEKKQKQEYDPRSRYKHV